MSEPCGSWSVARWAAVVLVAAASARIARADGPRGAEWASKDAVIYVEATHPEILLDRLTDPKMQGRLAAIPQYEKAIKGEQFKQLTAGVQFVSSLLETTWDEGLRKLAGGGVALAVEAEPGKAPWGFVALTPGDPAFLTRAHAKLLELARTDAKGKGNPDPIKEATHRGVTIYSGQGRGHAIVRDTLVIAQSAEAVQAEIVERALDGSKDSLTSDPEWRARRGKVSSETLAWGLVRLDLLREHRQGSSWLRLIQSTYVPRVLLFGPWVDAFPEGPVGRGRDQAGDAHLGHRGSLAMPRPPRGEV